MTYISTPIMDYPVGTVFQPTWIPPTHTWPYPYQTHPAPPVTPPTQQHVCPNCGYCPCCGRKNEPVDLTPKVTCISGEHPMAATVSEVSIIGTN